MTLARGVLRDVFARPHPDALLHLLADAPEPPLYTAARESLDLRPEEFKRALAALERWGLVQLRVVPRSQRPDNRRRVRLELTALGRAASHLHAELDASWQRIAAAEGLSANALAA